MYWGLGAACQIYGGLCAGAASDGDERCSPKQPFRNGPFARRLDWRSNRTTGCKCKATRAGIKPAQSEGACRTRPPGAEEFNEFRWRLRCKMRPRRIEEGGNSV